jgi:hypothetical protein
MEGQKRPFVSLTDKRMREGRYFHKGKIKKI